jgi:hypothetical protein
MFLVVPPNHIFTYWNLKLKDNFELKLKLKLIRFQGSSLENWFFLFNKGLDPPLTLPFCKNQIHGIFMYIGF